jgi:LacI family transcriptional regulator
MSVTRIAERAGVSIATVSRVLNNSRPVNPEIAERVRQAAEELQLPLRTSRRRGRKSGRGGAVAILSLGQSYREWFEMPVIAGVVAALTRAAQDAHLGVLMTEMPDPNQLSPILRRPEVEGALVFVNSAIPVQSIRFLRDQLPIVRVMGGQIATVDIDHVGPDNNSIGYLAAKHLIEQDVTQLAFMTSEPTWDFSKLRAQGFIVAAEAAGLSSKVYLRGEGKLPLGLYGRNVAAEADLPALVAHLARDTKGKGKLGLFVSRDEETVRVYPLLRDGGLNIDKDVVVVSCDNESVRLSSLDPRPASIDLNSPDIGRYAVRRLALRIKHPTEPPVRILVSPRFVPANEESRV